MNLLILGSGGHGRCVEDAAKDTGRFERICFLDDNGNDAIAGMSEYEKYTDEFDCAVVAIGDPELRREWTEKIRGRYRLAVIVHPKACVSGSANIGDGSVIMAGAVLQANVNIGTGCIISANAVVDHDAEIGDYSHINCNAVVSSMSKVPAETKVEYNEVYA